MLSRFMSSFSIVVLRLLYAFCNTRFGQYICPAGKRQKPAFENCDREMLQNLNIFPNFCSKLTWSQPRQLKKSNDLYTSASQLLHNIPTWQ
jgi:hypothetical protein